MTPLQSTTKSDCTAYSLSNTFIVLQTEVKLVSRTLLRLLVSFEMRSMITPSPEPQKDISFAYLGGTIAELKDFCGGLPSVLPLLIFGGKNQLQKTRESAIPFELFDFQNIILKYFIFNYVSVSVWEHVHMNAGAYGGQRYWILWSCRHRQL